jgi:hypothetical protein
MYSHELWYGNQNPANCVEFSKVPIALQNHKLMLIFYRTLNAPAKPTRFGVFRM